MHRAAGQAAGGGARGGTPAAGTALARNAGVAAAVAVLTVLALLAGCSGGDDSAGSTTTTTPPRTSTTAATSTTVPAPLDPQPGTGGVTVTPDPVPVGATDTSATVKVSWQGQKPGTLIFVRVCRRSVTDPAFSDGVDCSLLSELTPNGTPDGNGSTEVTLFRGENPDGGSGWGCFAPGDPVPPGVQGNTTCYVRVTNDVSRNVDDDRDAPFTFRAR